MRPPPEKETARALATPTGREDRSPEGQAQRNDNPNAESSPIYLCVACSDAAPEGWHFCRKCHAWNDIWRALQYRHIGVDQRRLRGALTYLAERRPREPLESVVRKLLRRVGELEALNARCG